ncbi:DNA-binding MarR family transcriptional regulator [Streptomyces sp. Amel2xB2]|uniref:MarR family winged helix-turn-helix transcriptional regulator n=1 Tax=Streptomyces sp. Amel2xB2 TaxID=1305829 RepID=UPI000DB92A87|nr:MarR family transcriptional regulator [Streptomyces sp. Amel2xB2]RAJ59880.1 DNA-binding MarR family transcriptional regulator [Streptomyces sp. Amel2xB2]
MTEPRWLDEREMAAWQSFLRAGSRIGRHLERQLKAESGLSHQQYEILVRLADAPDGELRMTELAAHLVTSKSGLTYQIGQLERRGLVRRRTCESDVRGVHARLTADGRRALRAAAPGHVAAVREALIDVLDRGELDQLAESLGRVARRLEEGEAPTGTDGGTRR